MVEFVPSIFCYEINRTRSQIFFRLKNEVIGGYQLWHVNHTLISCIKSFFISVASIFKNGVIDLFYAFKTLFFMIRFIFNKPEKFN